MHRLFEPTCMYGIKDFQESSSRPYQGHISTAWPRSPHSGCSLPRQISRWPAITLSRIVRLGSRDTYCSEDANLALLFGPIDAHICHGWSTFSAASASLDMVKLYAPTSG